MTTTTTAIRTMLVIQAIRRIIRLLDTSAIRPSGTLADNTVKAPIRVRAQRKVDLSGVNLRRRWWRKEQSGPPKF